MTPLVSIIIPVFNDADVISNSIESCLAQTLTAIEVLVVDDASTDETAAIAARYADEDARVTLIRQPTNSSAFQARRAGILAARAEHVLFLDGDDELVDRAAEVGLARATFTSADIVQFGVEVVQRDGRTGGQFERRLQPKHGSLHGVDVLRSLFPIDSAAQGQLWKYLFRRQILVDAYALMPDDLELPRVNDLPIAFLAASLATHYDSVPDRLYRYHFGRGGSGQKVRDLKTASFYAGAIRSVDSIERAVVEISRSAAEPDVVLATYASVRRAIIGYTTHYLAQNTRADLLEEVMRDLFTRASASDIVQSTAQYWPADLDTLATHPSAISPPAGPARSILLATNRLSTGGISGVVLAQASVLRGAGYRVTIVARETGSDLSLVPPGVSFAQLTATTVGATVMEWGDLCRANDADLVIEHQWQYSNSWPALALAARAEGAATMGWSHNFAGRSLLIGLSALETAPQYFDLLSHLVVLSPLDVAFWKLRGMPRVSHLPNPPSPFLVANGIATAARPAPRGRRLELVWWGRLQERTKRVTELVDVAEHLTRMGIDFRLRIIGPNWRDMNAKRLSEIARRRGLEDHVHATGPLHGDALLEAIDSSDIFVNTSVIEGYPLTIPEAQSRGLPVVMYELPWLALAEGNDGLIAIPWGDSAELARQIAALAGDTDRYSRYSSASLEAARREITRDYATCYQQLIDDDIPASRSPEPTTEDASKLIGLAIRLAELSVSQGAAGSDRATSETTMLGATRTDRGPTISIAHRLRPAATSALRKAPWLRPVARRIKQIVRRR